jgi:hypothetical protein
MLGLRRWRSPRSRRSSQAALEEHWPTLVLGDALDRLASKSDPQVLDLGPASTANVELLASVPARLHVADLVGALRSGAHRGLGANWEEWLPPDQHFDLIFTWDLLNYLTPQAIAHLSEALSRRCRNGTQLLAWISIRDPLLSGPGRFEWVSRREARRVSDVEGQRTAGLPSPRYREPQLLRWLDGFKVQRAFLLRHGVQEYLFTRATNPPETP